MYTRGKSYTIRKSKHHKLYIVSRYSLKTQIKRDLRRDFMSNELPYSKFNI